MNAGSLRLRLLAAAAVWVVAALLLTGAALTYMFTANVERTVHAELDASLDRLTALIAPDVRGVDVTGAMADPHYDVPFSGLYWQISDNAGGATLRSRSLWDVVLELPAGAGSRAGLDSISGPSGHVLASLSRIVRFESALGPRSYTITAAHDRSIIDQSIERFGRDMAAALAIVGMSLVAASWVQVQLGLRPLKALTAGIESIRRGRAESLTGSYPSEVLPLVRETNDLLAARAKSLESARARAADLAHGLKTPLSVLAATAEHLRERGDIVNATTLAELCDEMRDRVDYQLRLTRLRLRTRSEVLSTSLTSALKGTVSVLKKTREGENLDWRLDVDEDIAVDIDRHDLHELVGIILENAAKWARSHVEISTRAEGKTAVVNIADDGPGLDGQQIARLGVRGRRLDESKPGSGFGLAIASEIVALNNGSLGFERSARGGLHATLRLPLAPLNEAARTRPNVREARSPSAPDRAR